MSTDRYAIVLYGASGFTGQHVLESFVKNGHLDQFSFAVAGRSEKKLKQTLEDIEFITGKVLTKIPIIIADSSDAQQLAEMAKQAKVIVNVVGPYRLYGEAVVKAAVENGASHVDISGEPAWIEAMQMKYSEKAKEQGVFIVSACGWDSVPCDLGMNYLKQHFKGTLSHAETFAHIQIGEAGYSFNAGTYQTLILGLWQAKNDGLGKIRRSIMPEKMEKTKWRPPKRGMFWWNDSLDAYCLPFMGADKSIVQRSQYFDNIADKTYPASLETYILVKSWFWAVSLMMWLTVFNFAVKFDFTRGILQKYPGICSGYLFKETGPTRVQAQQASFTYWFFGWGWEQSLPQPDEAPTKRMVVRCDGPDAGYIGTAGCILSCALTILKERSAMPSEGGVFTTAAAFKNTNIYETLSSFGVTFRVDSSVKV
ncbi:hypothetical protein niasHS_002698 [Heterodera schachtii]|uniref:Saccharopine dehydrogenase NADP binding domain-containing protein n=1 Tax=Heterodera schachtii TaxID=97005 RepID=A0ABD2K271_HETSC